MEEWSQSSRDKLLQIQTPCLLFPTTPIPRTSKFGFKRPDQKTRYCLLTLPYQNVHLLDLPDHIHDFHFFIGAYKSWLFIAYEDATLFLFNPFSGTGIPLSSLGVCSLAIRKFVLSSSPTDPSCVVMAIQGAKRRKLVYFRLGDESWNKFPLPDIDGGDGDNPYGRFEGFVDLIHHENRFYALSLTGCVVSIRFSGKSVTVDRIKKEDKKSDWYDNRDSGTNFLVASSGNLLLVNSNKTSVSEFDSSSGNWVPWSNSDGSCLFVGQNYSVSLSPPPDGCRANCIYHANVMKNFPVVFHDIAVFDREDGTIQHLRHGQGILDYGMSFCPGEDGKGERWRHGHRILDPLGEAVWITPSLT